jgi:hypothetical protein
MIYTVNDNKIWIALQILWWTDNDHLDHPNQFRCPINFHLDLSCPIVQIPQ